MEGVVIKLLIAKATNNKLNPYITIQQSLIHYLNKNEINEEDFNKFTINPISSSQKIQELIFECFYWLKKISSYSQESYNTEYLTNKRIFNLLLVLIVNSDEFSGDILFEIKATLKNLDNYKDFYEIIENSIVYEKLFFEDPSIAELNSIKKSLIIKNEFGEKRFFLKTYENIDKILTIKIASISLEQIDANYINADIAWFKQYKYFSKRIISKKIIFRFYMRYLRNFKKILKNYKLSSNNNFCLNEFLSNYTINIEEKINIRSFLVKNKFILEFYDQISELTNSVINYYYFKIIDNGLDFHYILTFLNEISMKRQEFENSVRTQSNPEIMTKENIQKFVELKNQIKEMVIIFENWRLKKNESHIREINLNDNKKLIALKFARRHLYSRANKLYRQKLNK